MTASAFVTTNLGLPPAYLGQTYEAAIQATAPTNPTVLTSQTGNDTGLPAGLALNADKLRVTGTPTGAASTPAGSGVAQSGPGQYTFTLSPNATDSTVKTQFSIYLYAAQTDPSQRANMSTANQANLRNQLDQ